MANNNGGAKGQGNMFEYGCTVINVIDADTLKLDVDLGFKIHMLGTLRLARINAPELLSIDGAKAKAFTLQEVAKATHMRLRSSRSEKYGRWLGDLLYQTKDSNFQWLNLSDALLQAKHAKPYKW